VEIGLWVIRDALFPAGKENADPLEAHSTHCGMVAFTPVA